MNFLLAEGDDEPKAKEELVAEYRKLDEALGKVGRSSGIWSRNARTFHASTSQHRAEDNLDEAQKHVIVPHALALLCRPQRFHACAGAVRFCSPRTVSDAADRRAIPERQGAMLTVPGAGAAHLPHLHRHRPHQGDSCIWLSQM